MTIKELHKKTLPEYKKKYVKIDFVSYYLWRPICDLMTIPLLKTNVTATEVTIISFFSCYIALGAFIFIPGIWGALLGYLFFWIWNICDGIDGNIARYTDTCSRSGDLWDALAGYVAMFVFYFGAGIVAAGENSYVPIDFISGEKYVIMGAIAGVCTLLPRLATQKKESVYGKAAAASMKDRASFGPLKILALNIVSINGLSGVLLLIAILLHSVNIYIIAYFVVMLAFGIFSLYSTMKGIEK